MKIGGRKEFEVAAKDFAFGPGARIALFFEGADAVDAVESALALVKSACPETVASVEHYFAVDDLAGSAALRDVAASLAVRSAVQSQALVLIPGLCRGLVSQGRQDGGAEAEVIAYLFRMTRQLAGVEVPLLVPVHTLGLDFRRDALERVFELLGYVCIAVGKDEVGRIGDVFDAAAEAYVAMSGVAPAAAGILAAADRASARRDDG